tara:strand:- start:4799 stop:5050 length:252 start_codon:yes stop_codon:yes gene_type:complete
MGFSLDLLEKVTKSKSMNINEWEASVPIGFKEDVVWRMEVYRLSLFLSGTFWKDTEKIVVQKRCSLADQLYRSVSSIRSMKKK